jgi:hypothetical protein
MSKNYISTTKITNFIGDKKGCYTFNGVHWICECGVEWKFGYLFDNCEHRFSKLKFKTKTEKYFLYGVDYIAYGEKTDGIISLFIEMPKKIWYDWKYNGIRPKNSRKYILRGLKDVKTFSRVNLDDLVLEK